MQNTVAISLALLQATATAPAPMAGFSLTLTLSASAAKADSAALAARDCVSGYVSRVARQAGEGDLEALRETRDWRLAAAPAAAAAEECLAARGVRGASITVAFTTAPATSVRAGEIGPGQLAAPAPSTDAKALALGVLAEVNRVRADPAGYARELRAYARTFDGLVSHEPEYSSAGVGSTEGARAVEDAAAFAASQRPRLPWRWDDVLGAAAADHATEQGPLNVVGHGGSDGSGPGQRVQRRGGGSFVGEVISYGWATPRSVVRQLVVDDGVASRGHRLAVFSDAYGFAGFGCGPHITLRYMCVGELAANVGGR